MAPIYEFMCGSCGHQFEEYFQYSGLHTVDCPHECGKTAKRLPSVTGGYQMNSGGSSTRPKSAGSRPKVKRTKPEQLELPFPKVKGE